MKKEGFTLMELLVSIGIIASLAGLIYAACIHVREKALQTTCVSNLRQLGTALFLYAQDNDGFFPPYRNHPIDWPDNVGGQEVKGCYRSTDGSAKWVTFAPHLLFTAVNPYLREQRVWYCPSDPYTGTSTFYWCVFHKYTSYLFDFRDLIWLRDTGYTRDIDFDHIPFMLISDPNDNLECPEGLPDYLECVKWNKPSGGNHFGGVNQFFLDGSVKWYRFR